MAGRQVFLGPVWKDSRRTGWGHVNPCEVGRKPGELPQGLGIVWGKSVSKQGHSWSRSDVYKVQD